MALPTPCALVDLEVLGRNVTAMATVARRLGVALRPHVKTHKCFEAAHLQVAGQAGGITVSTLAEARRFAAAGFGDITYAVPIAPARLSEAVDLVKAGVRLGLLVDQEAALAEVERAAAASGARLGVWLEVDCGAHRSGVDPERDSSFGLAASAAGSSQVELRGILTHAGHAYACRNREETLAVARQERDVMAAFATRLRNAGVSVPEVSIGSTPTMAVIDDLTGISEIRPGNYVFHDAFQVAIGSCLLEDCAFSVLATVIGCYPESGRVVVDAGALALSKDAGPVHVDAACGYGIVRDPRGGPPPASMRLVSLTQEHGVVRVEPAAAAVDFPIGTLLRIIPNHSCLAAACFDRFSVLENGVVVDEWRPVRGW
jgi:D-serine deaminase-like pyridoxal phosphate-dependent protein